MSSPEKGYNINQTFIIETTEGDGVLSACTGFYTTNIYACTGNTQILLGSTSISTVGDLFVGGDLSATTISATTFYGDGSNLTGLSTQDTFVTGGTYSAGTAVFTNNTGGTFSVTGFYTGGTDVFVSGGTYSAGTAVFTNNTGGTFSVTGFSTSNATEFTGGTVTGATFFTNGLTANTISANTFSNTQFYDLYNDLPPTGETTTIYIIGQSSAYVYDTTINDYVLLNSPTPNNTPEIGEVFFVDLATQSTLIPCVYYNGPSNDGIGARLTGTTNEAIRETTMALNSGRIDSIVVQSGDTILVKNQSASLQNGIYQVLQVGSPSQPFIIERIAGYDQTSEIYPSQVNVISGSNNGNKSFFETIENPVIGFSAITYAINTTTSSQILPTIFVDTVTSSALPNNPVYISGTTLPSLPSYLAELSATTNGTFPTINGVSPFLNMRILVKNQVLANQNGDYVLIALGSASTRWRLRRLTYGWGGTNYLVREWEVNRSSSTEFGSRYSLSALTGTQSISNANWGNTGNLNFIQNNTEITGITYNSNTISVNRNKGLASLTANINSFTGLTVNGVLSATTYQNLPVTADTFSTAFTYSNNVFTISRNQGQSPLTATINAMTGLTVNGSTALNGAISSNSLTGTTDRLVQVNSGGTISATHEIVSAYITSGSTAAILLGNTSNWDINGNYTGTTITGTYQGQKYYDANYFYEAVLDNVFIRLIRG